MQLPWARGRSVALGFGASALLVFCRPLSAAGNAPVPEMADDVGRLAEQGEQYRAAGDAAGLAAVEKKLADMKADRPAALLALGRLLNSDEEFAEAAQVLEQALALNPDFFEAEKELGSVYSDLGNDAKAALIMEKALQQQPQEYGLTVALAKCYARMGRLEQAKAAFARAKSINSKDAAAYIEQGYTYLNAGQDAQSLREFEAVVTVDTTNPLGYHHMGSYLYKHHQYHEAEEYYRQALQRLESSPLANQDDLAHALSNLALTLKAQGKFTEAEAACRKGLELTRANIHWRPAFLHALGVLAEAQGQPAKAEQLYKQALVGVCEPGLRCSRYELAAAAFPLEVLYAAQKRNPEAEALLDRIGKSYDGHPIDVRSIGHFFSLAGQYMEIGQSAKAETFWRRILAARGAFPDNPAMARAEEALAGLYKAQGRWGKLEALYLKEIAVFKGHGDKASETKAWEGLALTYEEAGKGSEAAATRRRALGLTDDPESLRRMGEHARSVGDAAGVAAVEEKLAGLKTDRRAALLALVGLLRLEGKKAEATGALEQALALKPDDPDIERDLGFMYQGQGQNEKAVAVLEKAFKQMPQDHGLAIGLEQSYSALGAAYLKGGNLARAEREFKSAIALATASPIGYLSLASIYDELERLPDAEANYRQALLRLEAQPAWARPAAMQARLRLGMNLQKQGRSAEAERLFRQAMATCAPGPGCPRPDWTDAAIALGDIYIAQGRKPEAEALAERLWKAYEGVPVNTESIGVVSWIAQLYLRLGDSPKAEAPLRRMLAARDALPANPAMAEAEATLAGFYEAQGRWGELEALYLKETEFFKGHGDKGLAAGMLARLAAVYEEEGKAADAAAARRQSEALRVLGGRL